MPGSALGSRWQRNEERPHIQRTGRRTAGPVSYTHLDVYKRQPCLGSAEPADPATAASTGGFPGRLDPLRGTRLWAGLSSSFGSGAFPRNVGQQRSSFSLPAACFGKAVGAGLLLAGRGLPAPAAASAAGTAFGGKPPAAVISGKRNGNLGFRGSPSSRGMGTGKPRIIRSLHLPAAGFVPMRTPSSLLFPKNGSGTAGLFGSPGPG